MPGFLDFLERYKACEWMRSFNAFMRLRIVFSPSDMQLPLYYESGMASRNLEQGVEIDVKHDRGQRH